MRRFVRSLIHNATVTSAEHSAALKLDPVLMRAMEVRAFEDVEIVNVATGARSSAWVEEGAPGRVRVPQMRAGDIITVISIPARRTDSRSHGASRYGRAEERGCLDRRAVVANIRSSGTLHP
jgi:Aspartate decarboxylase